MPQRLQTILTFVVLGPCIGALIVFAGLAIGVAIAGGTASANLVIGSAALFLALGYALGLAPAAITGVAYAFAPPRLQRLWVAPLLGAAGVWLANVISSVASQGALVTGGEPMHLAAGAIAALACAWIVRARGWVIPESE